MIIEISAIALVFLVGYFVGNLRKKTQIGQKNIKKHKVHFSRYTSHNIRIISSVEQKDDEKSEQVEVKDEEKPLNKKKKNKKKRKQREREIQQEIRGRRQEQEREQKKQRLQSRLYESTTIPSLSQREQLQVQKQSKSSQHLSTSTINNNKKQQQKFNPSEQQCTDFVNDELQLLRNYFLYELQEIIPYSKSYGKYKLILNGTCKEIMLEWSYNNINSNQQQQLQFRGYPRQLIEIKFIYDSLKPIQIDKLNEIVNEHKVKFSKHYQSHQLYNYIFNLSTAIYQDLLMQIIEQPQQSFSLLEVTKHHHHKDSIQNPKTLNNTQHHHDTSQLFTVQKKEIYGKLFQEIFYMQDFKSEPNQSLLVYNHAQTVQKKHHVRGRYINEFQELEMIGQGGFGKVYKAKNRLDSNTYAIKKIAINYENSKDRKLLNEVTFFSTLNHPNIVRYHQSWLQDTSSMDELIHDMSITQSDEKEELQHIYEDWRRSAGMGGIFFQDHSKDKNSKGLFNNRDSDDEKSQQDDIMFEEDNDIMFEDYSEIQFEENSKSCSINNPHGKISFPHLEDSSQASHQNEKSDFPFKILYIVMEFVRGITLREFINTRFKQDEIKIQIIRGILEGLAYIHSKKIIHRDLKPANIFLTQNNKVKIGDFGLATTGTLEQKVAHEMYEKSSNYVNFQKTIGIGTAFYRAPQQLKSSKYDEKVDIYSLGIIIFEMFYEFSTYSERFKILSDITKNFTLPKDFNLYGQLTDYQINIENCIKQQPQIRPTAMKLLQNFRNKYFVHLVSAIANPKYAQFYELIKQLFQISNERRVQSVKRNYFRSYDFQEILNIYRIHRGNIFQSFPLIFANDFKTVNGMKIQFNQARKQKLLVLSQQGVLLQYTSSLYAPWIIYAKQTMKKRKHEFLNDQLTKVGEMRRFAFEKIVDAQHDSKKDENVFKEKYVTGFDICYDLEGGFSPFLTLQMLIISSNIVETLHLTQENPPLYICHSKIFTILSKHYKIPPYKLYTCLLSTSEQKFSSMTQLKRLQHLQKYQIEGITAKKISQLFQRSFDEFLEWIKSFQIWNIDEYSEYWEINEQIKKVTMLNEYFQLKSIQYKLMVPSNYCHGLFWNHGPLKGFTSIEDYTIGSMVGNLCNLNIQLTLTQGDDICDVSIWSNQQFLQSQIMQLVSKCWQMGVSAKYYQKGMGEKDDSSKMNMIIKKKKGQRVHYHIRKNENRKYNNKIKHQQSIKQISSVVVKQQFNHQVFKQIHNQPGTMTNLFNLSKKKSDSYVH